MPLFHRRSEILLERVVQKACCDYLPIRELRLRELYSCLDKSIPLFFITHSALIEREELVLKYPQRVLLLRKLLLYADERALYVLFLESGYEIRSLLPESRSLLSEEYVAPCGFEEPLFHEGFFHLVLYCLDLRTFLLAELLLDSIKKEGKGFLITLLPGG